MIGSLWIQRLFRALLVGLLLVTGLGTTRTTFAKPSLYSFANGITFAAGTLLPVFHITNPTITAAATEQLTTIFDAISNKSNANLDTYRGHDRFTMLNQDMNTILEQFGASGGFFAYNPTRAFGGDAVQGATLDPGQAQNLACNFLKTKQSTLFPTGNDLTIPGLSDLGCSNDFTKNPLYQVSTETLSGQGKISVASVWAANQVTTNTPLRIMVTLPIQVMVGNYNHDLSTPIPLGGPGGHISMIFDNTQLIPGVPGSTLDNAAIGLQAIAMPAFNLNMTHYTDALAADPVAAQAQVRAFVRASYPSASDGDIVVPTPALEYYVGDPGEPRGVLEPVLNFSGVTLVVNGQTITLRDLTLPGLESGAGGIGPTVTISSPTNGQLYLPNLQIQLKGSISDGTPPYNYDWQLDDGSSLGAGVLNSAGSLPTLTKTLPLPDSKGSTGSQTLHLIVMDQDGVTRESIVTLTSPTSVYLPSVQRGLANPGGPTPVPPMGANPASSSSSSGSISPNAVNAVNTINYRFGVEYGSDYPPYGPGGPDLGAVPPDANGLSTGLLGLGWPRVFNWFNALAWEKDWRDCSLGGGDCTSGVDRADFVYYAGHGSNGGLSVPSNSHDSSWFDGTNARFQNVRWAGFASCLTLRAQWPTAGAEPIRKWFNAFQGAHMLLGFNSVMADVPFGPHLVDNMRLPTFFGFIEMPWAQRTIAEAWVQTAWELGAGKPAYIYATSATVNPVANRLPKVGDALMPRPYPVNWYYWVWWNE